LRRDAASSGGELGVSVGRAQPCARGLRGWLGAGPAARSRAHNQAKHATRAHNRTRHTGPKGPQLTPQAHRAAELQRAARCDQDATLARGSTPLTAASSLNCHPALRVAAYAANRSTLRGP